MEKSPRRFFIDAILLRVVGRQHVFAQIQCDPDQVLDSLPVKGRFQVHAKCGRARLALSLAGTDHYDVSA